MYFKLYSKSWVLLVLLQIKNAMSHTDTGDLPKDWRDANLSSIFQKGDIHLPENYRPVSLTSVTSKILGNISSVDICLNIWKRTRS